MPAERTSPDEPEDPGEQWVIAELLGGRAAAGAPPVVDAGDDCAVLADGTAVAVDAMVEGVHFDDRLSAEDVGWKLVAINVSDLAATGCRAEWALLALSLPRPLDRPWVRGLAAGLRAAAARWGVRLVGGDTTRSPGPRVVSLTVGGRALAPVRRSGGRPGDRLWVTGAPGEAAAGFLLGDPDGLVRLRRPEPPAAFALALARRGLATAMMDLSDGLAADLRRLCRASGTGAEVEAALLPRGPAVARAADPLPLQVAFGDDYELLFAAPPDRDAEIRALAEEHGVRATAIGRLTAGPAVRLAGRDWPAPRFAHFAGGAP